MDWGWVGKGGTCLEGSCLPGAVGAGWACLIQTAHLKEIGGSGERRRHLGARAQPPWSLVGSVHLRGDWEGSGRCFSILSISRWPRPWTGFSIYSNLRLCSQGAGKSATSSGSP